MTGKTPYKQADLTAYLKTALCNTVTHWGGNGIREAANTNSDVGWLLVSLCQLAGWFRLSWSWCDENGTLLALRLLRNLSRKSAKQIFGFFWEKKLWNPIAKQRLLQCKNNESIRFMLNIKRLNICGVIFNLQQKRSNVPTLNKQPL